MTDRIRENVTTLRALTFLTVLGVLALNTACTPDSTGPADDANNTTATESPSAIAPEEMANPQEAAVAAYERYWRTVADATAIPDPDYPALDEVAADQALESARSLLQGGIDENHVGTGYPSHTAEVTESYPAADPTEFAIADCMDTSAWLVLDADSQEPVPGEEYGTSKVSALVERVDDQWLVTEVLRQRIGSC